MTTENAIVTIGTAGRAAAEEVLSRLEGIAHDGAVAYRTARGRLKVLQVSDVVPGQRTVQAGLLASAVNLLVAAAEAPAAPGAQPAQPEPRRFDPRQTDLVRRRLAAGEAVCCLLIAQARASMIVEVLAEAGLTDVTVTPFTKHVQRWVGQVTTLD